MAERVPESEEIRMRLHDPRISDRYNRLIGRDDVDPGDIEQVVEVMDAIFRWRQAEKRVSEASRRYMKLSDTDMRALRFAIVQGDRGEVVTAKDIARHLGISSASTTKLLDRLEAGGHVSRHLHPTDRRALAITVSEATRVAAEQTVGSEHARRFRVVASLEPHERTAVLKFLNGVSETSELSWPEAPEPA